MHPGDIKTALARQGWTQVALAKKLGVGQSAVSQVISGRSRSAEAEKAISEILGLPLYALWPQNYERPDDVQTYRKGRAVTNEGAEQIMLGLWRRLDPASQLRVLSMMNEILGGAAAEPKPDSDASAGMRGRNPEAHNTVSVGTNSGQVNTGSKVINRGKL